MLRNFLLTGVIFLLSCAIFWVTTHQLDPLGPQKILAHLTFFLSVFCGVVSMFTLLFFFGTEVIKGRKMGMDTFLISIRRAVLVGLFVTILMILQRFRLLGILEVVLLAVFLSLVEWIFVTNGK